MPDCANIETCSQRAEVRRPQQYSWSAGEKIMTAHPEMPVQAAGGSGFSPLQGKKKQQAGLVVCN